MVKIGRLKLTILIILLLVSLSLPTLFYLCYHPIEKNIPPENIFNSLVDSFSLDKDGNYLVIDKATKKLTIYDNYKKTNSYKVTVGKNHGNKMTSGDSRTPEGIFQIMSIENSSKWLYYSKNDSIDPIVGAYGPWFIRINVPGFNGIGIHGFYHDQDLGAMASRGCVRMNNEALESVVRFVKEGMPVIILPDQNYLEDRSELINN